MKPNKKRIATKPIQPKNTDFYRAFEEQFRGSREQIASRLHVYLPFVEPLKTIETAPIALDLGCGRGEWLELLQANGFQAKGVDLDAGMLSVCHELNLDVQLGDALDYLRGLDADSLSVVSAFHVVEHIPFEILRELSTEAYRVLKPSGLLILETPNSENLMVGTSTFYLDPTHQKPLPAQLLSFVVEYAGFNRVKTLYLQDSPELASAQQTSLVNVLGGVSPDYAIVAQKNTSSAMAALFNAPFEQAYGLRLDVLAARYDQETLSHTQWLQGEWDSTKQRVEELSKSTGQLEAELAAEQEKAESLVAQLSQANEQNAHLQAHAQWLQNEWDAAKVKIDELNHSSHHWWTVADGLNQENKTLYTSRSWRITKPLRLLSLGVSYLIKGLLAIPKGIWWVIKWLIHTLLLIPKAIWWLFKWPFKLILSGLIRYAIKRPAIKLRLFTWLRKYPKAYAHTLQFARVRGINVDAMPSTITTTQQPQITETQKFTMPVSEESTTDLTSLTPRARRIYLDLKEAMDSNNKEKS